MASGTGADRAPAPEAGVIAVLGAGVMGEALLSGLLRGGRSVDELRVSDRSEERMRDLEQRYAVRGVDAAQAVAEADTIILAVKPQNMTELLVQIGSHVRPDALVVSIAAGITTAFLEERLPDGVAVARAMPNTPALVDQGMCAVSPGVHCNPAQVEVAAGLMRVVGKVLAVPEDYQDAITAISGSGPAYIFYVVEAMIEAGVLLGLPRATATELTVQTLYGAATMLQETGEHPTVLRERVSSPGGTTMAALRELDDHKVRAAFLTAMEAAARRSAQLSAGN